jgi:uncharacterized membrane protein
MAACRSGWSGALDSNALFATVVIAIPGVGVICLVAMRQWWIASGVFALGAIWLLNILTEGNKSQAEHNVVLATSLLLLAYFLIVVGAAAKRAQRRAG